ncbi:ATPase AAA [Roseivivax halodurans JCM 10272]|uniref:ATPase AAA n=1 Tax=Roseivivax halodurans JCM 10272 TaxID=1449350 RepID=X7EJ15_9RHOB|nr:AAA family ATPase [Roseivivax halodurans]ETX15865.1 ATPase AAA [Roseivivax halodurans JCM 10272]
MSGLTLTARLDPEEKRGLVRLSRGALARGGLLPGDPVRVGGARETHGRAVPGDVADGDVALGACLAGNSGVAEGEPVTLCRAALAPLRSVALRLDAMERARPDDLRDGLFDMALTEGDRLRVALPGGHAADVEIAEVSPEPAGFLTEATTISLVTRTARPYDGIGGLETQIAQVHEVVAAPLLRPELYERLGLPAPRGILFTGPPGSGKTLLARAVAARTQASFFHIAGPEIVSKHYGESERALREIFESARRAAPAILFIDEIDAIAPARAALSDEKQVERRVVAQLLTLLDGLEDRGRVVVLAATNPPDMIDPALRRPGRFDREIAFRPPTPDQRRAILEVHLARSPLARDADLAAIAEASHGYVGADLAALAREAAVAALSRAVKDAKGEANVALEDLTITQADLRAGLDATGPSALRGLSSEARPVTWDNLGGLTAARHALDVALLQPRRHPGLCAALGVRPARGVLLSGPPGSGKTLLARALATETGMNLVPVRPPRVLSRYLGDAERAVSDIFRTARDTAPTLIFFDEFDALAPRRGGQDAVLDRIVAQLLVELDGLEDREDVLVVAATNRAASLDPALTRPGRFDAVIDCAVPEAAERASILAVHLAGRPCAPDVTAEAIAAETEGASGADLADLVAAAARAALARLIAGGESPAAPEITGEDVAAALAARRAALQVRSTDFVSEGSQTCRMTS